MCVGVWVSVVSLAVGWRLVALVGVPCLVGKRPCRSRAGLRVAMCCEEESRPTLALTFISGLSVVLTAHLPFACGSDGGCSNRAVIHTRVGRGREVGGASRSGSTENRIYRHVSSLLAYA